MAEQRPRRRVDRPRRAGRPREARIVLQRGPRGQREAAHARARARRRGAARARSRRAPARRTRRGPRAGRRCRCRAGRAPSASPRSSAHGRSRSRSSSRSSPSAKHAGSPSTSIAPGTQAPRLAQDQPRRHRAVPAVDLQLDGGVGGLALAHRQRAAAAEGHAARAGAAGAERERDVAALAERLRVGHRRRRDEQRDRRGCPCRTGRAAGAPRPGPATARRPGRRRRSGPRGTRSSGESTSAACSRNASRKASTSDAGDRQARRGLVAAVAEQVPGARVQAAEQVEGADRAAGAAALLAVERDQDRRPVVALGDPRGDDPDHAGMPALRRPAPARGPRDARRPAPRPRSGSGSRRRGARR